MTNISLRNGRVVLKDDKVGTEQDCCKLDPFCDQCQEGWLPDTITVTFDGWPADELVEGPPLILLSFQSCAADLYPVLGLSFSFSPAAGKVDEPGGAAGALSSASITAPGAGYAIVGRVAPTLTISGGSGTGADLDAVLDEVMDAVCGLVPHWVIDSVTVNDGGQDYADGDSLTVSYASGDTEQTAAALIANTTISAPTVTVTVSGTGSGASLSVNLTQDDVGPKRWRVSSVTITNGGTGYTDFDSLVFDADTANGDVVEVAESGYVGVDGNGAINAIFIGFGGRYYNDDGVIASVTVSNAGKYHREDTTVPAIVPTVTVNATQYLPSAGTGGTFTATVDDDPDSATFGQITGVTASGGSGYLAYEMVPGECFADYINGRVYVLKRLGSPTCCSYSVDECNIDGGLKTIFVHYYGPDEPPTVDFQGSVLLTSTTNVSNCSDFSFTAEDGDGRTAVVEAGGERDPRDCVMCDKCCRNEADSPCEVEVTIFGDSFPPETTVVLQKVGDAQWQLLLPGSPGVPGPMLYLNVVPCDYQPQDAEDCLHCWKKCETVASIVYSQCTLTFTGDRCQGCEDSLATPICAPQSGTYVLDNRFNPGGCSDGNSQWTVIVP